MLLLLVRHGHAGSKRHWHGDDQLRPLTQQGLAEAEALEELLAPFAPTRILSSPYARCVQTVTPLATRLGMHVERTNRLVPSAGRSAATYFRRVSRNVDGAVVLCTHGEVIRALQEELPKTFAELFGDDAPREKGSVWALNRVDGQIVSSAYLAPAQPGRS